MRRTLLVLSTLLAAGAGPGPATQPTTQPTHDRDPWVFRCVLDDNPRMLVISLGHHVWAAYDTQHATLAKLWVGDVDFTGAVFDTKHGPQPRARGTMLIDAPMPIASATDPTTQPAANPAPVDYLGCSIADGVATVHFRAGDITVDDRLVAAITAPGEVVVDRTVKLGGKIDHEHPYRIRYPTAGSVTRSRTWLDSSPAQFLDASTRAELSPPRGPTFFVPDTFHFEMTFKTGNAQ